MTVSELIQKLEQVNPYLVVRVWDTRNQKLTDRFYVQSAAFDNELLITPSDGAARQLPPAQWESLFQYQPPGQNDYRPEA